MHDLGTADAAVQHPFVHDAPELGAVGLRQDGLPTTHQAQPPGQATPATVRPELTNIRPRPDLGSHEESHDQLQRVQWVASASDGLLQYRCIRAMASALLMVAISASR